MDDPEKQAERLRHHNIMDVEKNIHALWGRLAALENSYDALAKRVFATEAATPGAGRPIATTVVPGPDPGQPRPAARITVNLGSPVVHPGGAVGASYPTPRTNPGTGRA